MHNGHADGRRRTGGRLGWGPGPQLVIFHRGHGEEEIVAAVEHVMGRSLAELAATTGFRIVLRRLGGEGAEGAGAGAGGAGGDAGTSVELVSSSLIRRYLVSLLALVPLPVLRRVRQYRSAGVRVHSWMGARLDGRTGGWVHGWMGARVDGCTGGWVHGWMGARVDGWIGFSSTNAWEPLLSTRRWVAACPGM